MLISQTFSPKVIKNVFFIFIMFVVMLCDTAPALARFNGQSTLLVGNQHSEPISQSNISDSSIAAPNGSTYTINQSGAYFPSISLSFTPQAAGDYIISIEANDVTLDLAGLTITADDSKTTLRAINIASGYSNINIRNGRINKMTGEGIYINSSCSGIHLSNLLINDCDLGGIVINGANNVHIDTCTITNCVGTSAIDAFGLKIIDSDYINVNNSVFSKSVHATLNAMGVWLTTASSTCKNCVFTDCQSHHNGCTTATKSAYGFRCDSTTSCTFQNCQAFNNGPGTSNTALNVYGFYNSSCTNNLFDGCTTASNSTTAAAGNVYGFYLSSCRSCQNLKCETRDNSAATASGGNAYGVFSTAGNSNLIKGCKAHGNRAGTSTTNICAGFAFENGEIHSGIQDSTSMSNDGGTGEAYGIKIGGSSGSDVTICHFDHNSLWSNFATTKQYGLKDFSSNSTALITRNTAYGHGQVFRGTSTITDAGTMNFYVSYTPDEINNPENILTELSRSEIKAASTAGPLDNISIYHLDNLS